MLPVIHETEGENTFADAFEKQELIPAKPAMPTAKDKNIISHKDITSKTLYYNAQERTQIDTLTNLLDEARFREVQQRLADSGMRKGFACYFLRRARNR
jgi:hypothetical protein